MIFSVFLIVIGYVAAGACTLALVVWNDVRTNATNNIDLEQDWPILTAMVILWPVALIILLIIIYCEWIANKLRTESEKQRRLRDRIALRSAQVSQKEETIELEEQLRLLEEELRIRRKKSSKRQDRKTKKVMLRNLQKIEELS